MNPVFADTFYWIALTNPRDSYFQEVLRFDDLLSEGNVSTKEVLAEVLTFFAVRPLRSLPRPGFKLDRLHFDADDAEGFSEILTNDGHFEQQGFRAIFRSA